ncbi:MAG: hypothetical protein ABI468_06340 [Candidatus Nanopelagicales bacterium]
MTVRTLTVPTGLTTSQFLPVAARRVVLSRPRCPGLVEVVGATTVHHPVPRQRRGPGRVCKSVTGTAVERVGAAPATRPFATWMPGLLGERAS